MLLAQCFVSFHQKAREKHFANKGSLLKRNGEDTRKHNLSYRYFFIE